MRAWQREGRRNQPQAGARRLAQLGQVAQAEKETPATQKTMFSPSQPLTFIPCRSQQCRCENSLFAPLWPPPPPPPLLRCCNARPAQPQPLRAAQGHRFGGRRPARSQGTPVRSFASWLPTYRCYLEKRLAQAAPVSQERRRRRPAQTTTTGLEVPRDDLVDPHVFIVASPPHLFCYERATSTDQPNPTQPTVPPINDYHLPTDAPTFSLDQQPAWDSQSRR